MVEFSHRAQSQEERWVAMYEDLIASLPAGYDMSVDEYANDISCRQRLDDDRTEPGVEELWQRVEIADSRLREILEPTKRCIHGSYPPTCFWYWGYPPNPSSRGDLRSLGAL